MKRKFFVSSFTSLIVLFLIPTTVFAHVVVSPAEVGLALRQDFSVGVPNEKDIPTTELRLVLPENLESVTPYVKPGWTIETKKTGEGEDAKVTEITWKGGSVGVGLRDAFSFRAMTPSDPTTLVWKAYQTYSDGTVVSWDQEVSEGEEAESETSGPYSKTEVINDLTDEPKITKSIYEQWAPILAPLALLIALLSLVLTLRKRSV
jgi:uncharacterized protein YcnI